MIFYFWVDYHLNKREKLCDSHSPFDGMKHLIIRRGGLPMTIIPVNHNTSSLATSNTNVSIGGHCHRMTSSDYLGFLFTALGEIPGLLLCFGLADRLGRRPALSVLCFVSVLAMSLLHACLNRYLLVGTLFILRAFVTGFIQTVYLYTPEVYPTNIRAIGFGTASSMARIGAIITPFVSEVLLDTYPHHAIFIYSGLMAVCIFASLLLPIETKGMKLKEFEEESEPNDNG
ncbi:synaptic vesicle 2-related protein-like [Clytia hemisphaerica]